MSAEQKMFEANFSNNGTFSKKKLTPFLVSDILEMEIDKSAQTVVENKQISESVKVNSMCANYEHHSHCNKRNKTLRKARTAFTDCQLQTLEKTFERQQYLSVQDRIEIANKLHLSDTQVKTWYQNRRTKWKRQTAVGLELLAEASNFNAFQRLLHSNPYYWSTYANVCNAPVDAYSRGYCAMEPNHFSCPNQTDRTSTSHNCSADSKY